MGKSSIFGSEDRRLKMRGFFDLRVRRSKMGGALRTSPSQKNPPFFEESLPFFEEPPLLRRTPSSSKNTLFFEEFPPFFEEPPPSSKNTRFFEQILLFEESPLLRRTSSLFRGTPPSSKNPPFFEEPHLRRRTPPSSKNPPLLRRTSPHLRSKKGGFFEEPVEFKTRTHHGWVVSGGARRGGWAGRARQDGTPTCLFAQNITVPRALQGIENKFPEHPFGSTNKGNPM